MEAGLRSRSALLAAAVAAALAFACFETGSASSGTHGAGALKLSAGVPAAGAETIAVEVRSSSRRPVAIEQRAEGSWAALARLRPDKHGRASGVVRPAPAAGIVALRARQRPRGLVSKVVTVEMPAPGPADPAGPAAADAAAAPAPPAPAPAQPQGIPVGFNNNAVTDRVASATQAADLLAAVGADIDRVQVSWKQLEPEPGRYRFSTTDAIYRADLDRGVRPLFIFAFAPDWASGAVCAGAISSCHAPPAPGHYDDAARAAAALAARYPQAAGIEIWNEPNTPYFWRPRPDPDAYAELLDASREAIRAVDPDMPVAGGAMASGAAGSPGKIGAHHFLAAVYESDAGAAFDVLSMHVYPDPSAASAVAWVERVRAVRDRYGDRAPIWITETGVSTTGPDAVTPAAQAATLTDLDRALRTVPSVEMLLFHTLVEPPRGTTGPETGFGIVGQDLTAKPGYCALGAAWTRSQVC